ncbi:MAG: hypothetical protein R2861_03785 [Desulfobacterales bacterium]
MTKMAHDPNCTCFLHQPGACGICLDPHCRHGWGVLKTMKWARIFEKQNFKCFYFAGELDTPPEVSSSEKSHFSHPDIRKIYKNVFDNRTRKRSITQNS